MPDDLPRCRWANPRNPTYLEYHDSEWGVPVRDDRRLFEILVLECFQAGLSWECVLNRRAAFREAYGGFDPAVVAGYGEGDVSRLMSAPGMIRNEAKIRASIANAKVFVQIQGERGSFSDYLWGFTGGRTVRETGLTSSPASDALAADLRRRGMRYVGSVTMYAYMQAIGLVDAHEPGCFLFGRR